MTSETAQLNRVREMLEAAESNLKLARQLLGELTGETESSRVNSTEKYSEMASAMDLSDDGGTSRVIEGIFDGQNMIGPDGKAYPIAANYASKSKLIPGDQLKLTIGTNGSFIYKQIGPTERKRIIGKLMYDDGMYKVLVDGKGYNVLLASVTYFKAELGDEITLIVPADEESDWGAIENVIPQ